MAELNAGLDPIRQSPSDVGTLHMIVVRPVTNERAVLTECDASPDGAIHGDRWFGSSKPRDVSVTLMNSRAAALIAQDESRWPLAGDQLYVDFDLSEDKRRPKLLLSDAELSKVQWLTGDISDADTVGKAVQASGAIEGGKPTDT